MPDPTAPAARWVETDADIDELVALVTDPEREGLLVCVTKRNAAERPLVDPDRLAADLGDLARVWVVVDPDHAWELTEALPPKIDVYGGAVRAWQPMAAGEQPFPSDHPQWKVFDEGDAARVQTQIVEYAQMLAGDPPPRFGAELTGTVTAVRKAGAELTLDTGHPAFASSGHLIQHGEVFHAGEILQPGQVVTVKAGPWNAQAGRLSVSLRDFAPDPWERLAEVYRPGDVIDGVVTAVREFGAFVELMPGVEGLLHKSKITDAFVSHVDEHLATGDRVTLRLLTLEPYDHKAEISMRDVPAGTEPLSPAPVFEGGPPWLPDSPDAFTRDELPDLPEPLAQAPQAAAEPAPAAAPATIAPAPAGPAAPAAPGTLGPRFADATAYAVALHGAQARKDPAATPYLAHLLAVTALVLEHGGEEDDAIAALLHDAIEDGGGAPVEAVLAERFGPLVAQLVRDVTDTDEDPKPPWRPRKEAYLAHIAEIDERAIRVSASDKLHNTRALLADFHTDGEALWERFNAGRDDQLWIHEAYATAFQERLEALGAADGPTAALVADLRAAVTALSGAVAAA